MAVYVVVAPDLWATSSSTCTSPPPEAGQDFSDLMKQLALSRTKSTLSTPNSPTPHNNNNNMFIFSATSSSSSPKVAGLPDFSDALKKFKSSPSQGPDDFMKQFALSLSRTFTLLALNSPAPPQAHNNNMFTFSYTPSSTSAGIPDFTYAMKKFKPSPPSRRCSPTSSSFAIPPKARILKRSPPSLCSAALKSIINDFDAKFNNTMTNLMEQFTLSPSGTFPFSAPPFTSAPAQVNHNMSTFKPTDDEIVNHCIYDDLDPFYLSPEFVIPPHIKESCELALEKYNNENGTSYKYVSPELVLEKKKAHDTSHFFSFTASTSGFGDYYDCETFTATFKSGFRFSEGKTSYFKELEQVSRRADQN